MLELVRWPVATDSLSVTSPGFSCLSKPLPPSLAIFSERILPRSKDERLLSDPIRSTHHIRSDSTRLGRVNRIRRQAGVPAMERSKYFPSRKHHQKTFSRSKLAVAWPSLPIFIPHRLRRKLRSKLRSRQSPSSSIASLQTSYSAADTIPSLRSHRWSYYDAQYLLLAIVGIFSLCVIESPGPVVKTGVATLLFASLLVPVTRQFFLPFLPIATWLVFFYACR